MKINEISGCIRVYGETSYRGACPEEAVEQATFFGRLRRHHPNTWGKLALHPRNEQQLRGGQHRALMRQKAEGMSPGAADIIIPARVAFVCELKRRDHTKSKWQDGQIEYLTAAAEAGAWACVAFGADAAWQAFEEWLEHVAK